MKTCSKCGKSQPDEQFRVETGRATRRANCRECEAARQRDWKRRNVDRVHAYDKARYRKRRDRWASHIRRKYGLTAREYDELLASQGGRCAICGIESPGGNTSRFHVDHDHASGRVRGLLCICCNQMLGTARDQPDTLRRGAEYLERIAAPVAEAFVRAYMETIR